MKLNIPRFSVLKILLVSIIVFTCVATGVLADGLPFLHPLFSDHMVLQRDVKVPVWGWANPGAKVTVTFGGQTKTAVAEADGKWMVRLNAMGVFAEPRTLTVSSSEANQNVTIQDVLVGDVWLCSGQSN